MSDNCADGADRSIPTPEEDELIGTLENVARTGQAQCRLCDHVVEGDNYGEIFEALVEHGEEAHEWDDRTGWSVDTDSDRRDAQ